MDPSEEIKRLYFEATPKTIDRDLARAIDLLRAMPDEEARERLAVYMDGLAQMRSEAGGGGGRSGAKASPKAGTPRPRAGAAGSEAGTRAATATRNASKRGAVSKSSGSKPGSTRPGPSQPGSSKPGSLKPGSAKPGSSKGPSKPRS